MTLMKLGIMANINQNIDEDTVMILAEGWGIRVAIRSNGRKTGRRRT